MKNYKFPLQLILLIYLLCSCKQSPSTNSTSSEENAGQEENWQPLFNHENLEGWHSLPGGNWEVQQGTIVGTSPAEEPLHGILLSNETYADFKLKVVYKAIKGNSGVYFRVEKVDHPVHVFGLQAEIDPEKDAGGLYETGDRAWVVQPTPENVKKWYKPNEWNEMIIVAKGKDVAVYLNGYKTAELKNDPGRTEGHIGLQLHGDMEMNVIFKDVLITENPEDLEI
ncbi:MAG: DUF1080 domain-containing protein [Anditalea sp.]